VRKPDGYLIITGPDGPAVEADTISCAHCQRVVIMPVRTTDVPDGGWCMTCARALCGPCADAGVCTPFEKRLARAESRGRLLASVGLGLMWGLLGTSLLWAQPLSEMAGP
jgi:hypothetical protein